MLSISDFYDNLYALALGDSINYKLMHDKDGRIRAYDAYVKGQSAIQLVRPKTALRNKAPEKSKPGLETPFVLIVLMPFVFSAWIIAEQRNILPFVVYLVMSLFTFLVYARDKTKAHKDEWRIAEATLHLLELLGGWPGALIAQKWIRHKNKKVSFLGPFWIIVMIHLTCWFYVIYTLQK